MLHPKDHYSGGNNNYEKSTGTLKYVKESNECVNVGWCQIGKQMTGNSVPATEKKKFFNPSSLQTLKIYRNTMFSFPGNTPAKQARETGKLTEEIHHLLHSSKSNSLVSSLAQQQNTSGRLPPPCL